MSLFNLEDDDEETVLCRPDSLPCRTRHNADDVKKLAPQLRGFDVVGLHMTSAEEDGDSSPYEMISEHLTAQERERDMQVVITKVKELLEERVL